MAHNNLSNNVNNRVLKFSFWNVCKGFKNVISEYLVDNYYKLIITEHDLKYVTCSFINRVSFRIPRIASCTQNRFDECFDC